MQAGTGSPSGFSQHRGIKGFTCRMRTLFPDSQRIVAHAKLGFGTSKSMGQYKNEELRFKIPTYLLFLLCLGAAG